jgi:hypothetical protein
VPPIKIHIYIYIYSVPWLCIFKFYHFDSGQIIQHFFIFLPKHGDSCGWLTNVVTPKFQILAINFDLFWKNNLVEFVLCLFYFQNLTGYSLSYFILYFISMFNFFLWFFFLSFFSKYREVNVSISLEAAAYIGFYSWQERRLALGAML